MVSAVFGGYASQTNALSLMAVQELASLPLLFVSIYAILAGAAPGHGSAAARLASLGGARADTDPADRAHAAVRALE